MSTELAEVQSWTPDKVDLIKRTICVGATDDELQLFLYVCKKTGLDPLTRQIYALRRWRKDLGREVMTIQTGIDGYRVIAERTGKLLGISDPVFDVEDAPHPNRATVTVKKLVDGHIAEFTATARWNEYVQLGRDGKPTGMWAKMPYLMPGKCAESLALRKAFPADLSGVYTAEEMAQADSEPERKAVEAEVVRQKQEPAALPPELDWMYQKSSGVMMSRIVTVAQRKTKKGSDYLTIGLSGTIDGSSIATYFHASHQTELLAAKGKVCKFGGVTVDGKFVNIAEVLEVDGQTIAKSEPEGDPEVKARLLASTMDLSEGDLKVLLTYALGDWAVVLSQLEQRQMEVEVAQ